MFLVWKVLVQGFRLKEPTIDYRILSDFSTLLALLGKWRNNASFSCLSFLRFFFRNVLKDTHRKKKTPSNKTSTLSKSMNMDIWVVGTSNQLFLCEVLKLKQNFRKNKVVTGKTRFFVIGPFCIPYSIYLNIGF